MKNNCLLRKICFVLSLFLFLLNLNAQVGTWKPYMAYQDASWVAETPNKVFAVYNGSLLSYTPEDASVKKYSKADGLNDISIKFMEYNTEAKALILVYDNYNIDILNQNGFNNIASIKNSSMQDKTVSNVEMIGPNAYLSTEFGIIVVDLKKCEIKATYRLNKKTRSVCADGQYLYAATSDGIYKGLMTSNLIDEKNWIYEPVSYSGNEKNISKILFFKEQFVFYEAGPGVFYRDTQGAAHRIQNGVFKQLVILNNQLVLNGLSYISFYTDFNSEIFTNIDAQCIAANNSKDQYWLAQGTTGLVGISKKTSSPDYTTIVSGIEVNSPKRNLAYYLTYTQNKLLVAGGGQSTSLSRDITSPPGTLMVYEDGKWFNFDEKAISEKTGLPCLDFTSVAVDPRDPFHYFVSSWGEGLYEFKNNEFVQLHSFNNSTLTSALPNESYANRFVRVDGLVYDKDNNLYMTNSEVPNMINIYSASNQWGNPHFSNLPGGIRIISQRIIIDRNNQKWVNLPRQDRVGIFVFKDQASAYSSSFTDQQGYNLNATGYFCLAEDLIGNIWVGTDNGPIYFNSPKQIEDGRCFRVIAGSNDNPYRLMEGIKVTAIAIDGGNRKWFGTEGNGIFCVDTNGEEPVTQNFTTENSLLISDNINSIAINNSTGEIFIGTDKGLISYMGDAIAGKPDYSHVYAYPNPVKPASDNRVVITGLMEKSTVKITDLNGNLIIQGTSAGGQFTWNCKKRTGETVTSGIYLVFASTPEGNQGVVTKIMVIK